MSGTFPSIGWRKGDTFTKNSESALNGGADELALDEGEVVADGLDELLPFLTPEIEQQDYRLNLLVLCLDGVLLLLRGLLGNLYTSVSPQGYWLSWGVWDD